MSDSLINIIINTVKRGNGDKDTISGIRKLNANFKELTGISLGSMTAVGMAGAAISGIAKFLKESVTETVEYATQVDNMSRLLGISTEDTSRLIQATDDLFISQEKLQSGLQAATRQGIDVSIEGLKKLSDEYLALPAGVERSEFVMKTFGRSGAEMGKLMEIGAAGIDEATAAIAANMIVTDQSMAEIMNYKRSMDELNDTWQGFKYTVGTEVIPELDLFLRMLYKGNDEVTKMELKAWRLEEGMFGLMGKFEGNREKAAELRDQIAILKGGLDETSTSAEGTGTAIVGMGSNLSTVTQYFSSLTEQMIFNKLAANMTEDAALALGVQMGLLDPMTYSLSLKMGDLTTKYDLNRDGVIDAKEATGEYYAEVLKLQDAVNGLQSKTIDIVVNWKGEAGGIGGAELTTGIDLNGNGIIGAAKGANFTVPQGFPNDSLLLGVSSGEHVKVTPAGKNGGSNITFNISGAGDPKAVANEVMRRLHLQGGV